MRVPPAFKKLLMFLVPQESLLFTGESFSEPRGITAFQVTHGVSGKFLDPCRGDVRFTNASASGLSEVIALRAGQCPPCHAHLRSPHRR